MYRIGSVEYGGAREPAAARWQWIQAPGVPKSAKAGGRLIFRAHDASTWEACATHVQAGRLGQSIGRPSGTEASYPILVNVADPHDAADVQRVASAMAKLGLETYVVKTAQGEVVYRSDDPADVRDAKRPRTSDHEDAARHPPVHAMAGMAVQDEAPSAVDWSCLGVRASVSGRMSAPDALRCPKVGETTLVAPLPQHANITLEGVLALLKSQATPPQDPQDPQEPKSQTAAFPQRGTQSMLKPSEFYQRFVARTPQQCAAELAAPQRSTEWLRARSLSITASDFGAAVGHNAHCSPEELVERKLWESFTGNDATAWGSHCEDFAAEAFGRWAQRCFPLPAGATQLHHENLMKSAAAPWMAVSPDGFLERMENGQRIMELVEFKCPTRDARQSGSHPYASYPGNIPPYYADQMQGIAGYLNTHLGGYRGVPLTGIYFVVWRPAGMWVTRVQVDAEYYARLLLPALQSFYFSRLLPAFAHKYNGRLESGQTVPMETCKV
jgi:putative phage-type endonuclease